jgi:Rad3-related DNA helicase
MIDDVLTAFDEYKYVLLNAPWGSGKTIVATAVQRLMDVRSVNLTHTIQLQRQYLDTMTWASVATGRRNHACELDILKATGVTADEAPCKVGAACEYIRPDGCSYYQGLYAAAANPQAVLNYSYAVRILQGHGVLNEIQGNPFRRDLLVCDEGDLAEAAIIDGATIELDKTFVDMFSAPPRTSLCERFIAWAHDIKDRVMAWLRGEQEGVVCDDHSLVLCDECDHHPSSKRISAFHRATAFVAGLSALAKIKLAKDWTVIRDNWKVCVRPIWGWAVAQDVVFCHFKKVLIMSATLGDPATLACKLDLAHGDWVVINVPCIFPVENRPVLYWPVAKMSRKSTAADFDALASAINWLAHQDGLENKKGIIHTGSFRLAEQLFSRLKQRSARYILHAAGEQDAKDTIISKLRHDKQPLVVLSPSLATGLDVPYEIGFQIVAKVPFGNLADPVVRARKDYKRGTVPFGQMNYDNEAINAVVQAYGRAVRAPDDQGVTFILDGHFWPLYKRTYTPEYFSEALRWLRKDGN